MNDFLKDIVNYVLALILLVLGLMFFIMYVSADDIEAQPKGMLVGSLFLIIAGVLVTPKVAAKINGTVAKIVLALGLIAGAYLAYSVVFSVESEIDYLAAQEAYDQATIRRLLDIRDAQEAYKEYKGRYANNFDSLVNFIEAPVIPLEYKSGIFHDSLGGLLEYMDQGLVIKKADIDSIAESLGYSSEEFDQMISKDMTAYKVRDTTYVSFYELNFTEKIRSRKKLPPVSLDSLPYNPSGDRFVIKTGRVNQGGVDVPTILVKDPSPFGRNNKYLKKDTLMFGSLTEPHTDGNWRK